MNMINFNGKEKTNKVIELIKNELSKEQNGEIEITVKQEKLPVTLFDIEIKEEGKTVATGVANAWKLDGVIQIAFN